jgi:hypothetical protein
MIQIRFKSMKAQYHITYLKKIERNKCAIFFPVPSAIDATEHGVITSPSERQNYQEQSNCRRWTVNYLIKPKNTFQKEKTLRDFFNLALNTGG